MRTEEVGERGGCSYEGSAEARVRDMGEVSSNQLREGGMMGAFSLF